MKIGYPCLNRSIDCTPNKTFRLASYSEEKIKETIQLNLDCLKKTLNFNFQNELLFFRIGSSLIPFASHPVCQFNWQLYFKKQLQEIGIYLKKHHFRISMHPDQFVLINAIKKDIVKKSIKEIEYHCELLDLMDLDSTAKVQIHLGGVYGDKKSALNRFIDVYKKLSKKIKKRLVIENDHLSYSLNDCLYVSKLTGMPIIFDVLHHECLNDGEDTREAVIQAMSTWKKKDGKLMIDYSIQKPDALKGSHAESVNMKKFKVFLSNIKELDFDIMLEIKDKEKSALKVIKEIKSGKINSV